MISRSPSFFSSLGQHVSVRHAADTCPVESGGQGSAHSPGLTWWHVSSFAHNLLPIYTWCLKMNIQSELSSSGFQSHESSPKKVNVHIIIIDWSQRITRLDLLTHHLMVFMGQHCFWWSDDLHMASDYDPPGTMIVEMHFRLVKMIFTFQQAARHEAHEHPWK